MKLLPSIFWRYPLWKGVNFIQDYGWHTYWYGITIGPIGIGIMIRKRREENANVK